MGGCGDVARMVLDMALASDAASPGGSTALALLAAVVAQMAAANNVPKYRVAHAVKLAAHILSQRSATATAP